MSQLRRFLNIYCKDKMLLEVLDKHGFDVVKYFRFLRVREVSLTTKSLPTRRPKKNFLRKDILFSKAVIFSSRN